jgi:hypothetical protein
MMEKLAELFDEDTRGSAPQGRGQQTRRRAG